MCRGDRRINQLTIANANGNPAAMLDPICNGIEMLRLLGWILDGRSFKLRLRAEGSQPQ
jgi:hypothetical protein